MNDTPRVAVQNRILSALPPEDFARILPLLERVDLPLGKVLYAPNDLIKHVYFPEDAMISVVAYTDGG